ncbi:MAG: MarR family transcriptional regulator [Halieaceae bacterium]|jgi:DNA-binding MarR family transcriptional regulator|nr:MarR family transcriptional regulator [Halieaceae bacterium]
MSEETRLIELLDRLARVVGNDRTALGLNPVQWEALRFFARANRFSRNPSGLRQYLGVTKGTVSQSIIALEKKGLLKKVPDPRDRRGVEVRLTAKGRKLLMDDPLNRWQADLARLPAAERRSLEAALGHLLRAALQSRQREPFGFCKDCVHFSRHHEAGVPHFCALLEAPLSDEDSQLICREQTPA